ncbi:hypothetical protein B7494_g6001 [Chlorociboria aeruginascens]|nr:hypothetical protein B7494_g6001 [Chlorociboria aeruginascens]
MEPVLQVIVLGSGGGPKEDNTTAFLVRSTAERWRKGSLLAVDAGVHLAAISRILQAYVLEDPTVFEREIPTILTSGPLKGLELPFRDADANAAYITRTMVDAYLISHPHLDHITGFVVNTAALSVGKPKTIAALPVTIEAFKDHIFNNVIWPNLSDENNGAGLVTYLRLVEGGSPRTGSGPTKGYLEICEGLAVKAWSISHGHCIENHPHLGTPTPSQTETVVNSPGSFRRSPGGRAGSPNTSEITRKLRESSRSAANGGERPKAEFRGFCVYDSCAYFIQDVATGREVLIWGDVEPDSISLSPRNSTVWKEAAPKILAGNLLGMFIECSYDDSQTNDTLFGHMSPRHLIAELKFLGTEILRLKGVIIPELGVKVSKEIEQPSVPEKPERGAYRFKKRKTTTTGKIPSEDGDISYTQYQTRLEYTQESPSATPTRNTRNSSHHKTTAQSPLKPTTPATPTIIPPTPTSTETAVSLELPSHSTSQTSISSIPEDAFPLKGLKVVIVHIKERFDDGPAAGHNILNQLRHHDQEAKLGCEFVISVPGMDVSL